MRKTRQIDGKRYVAYAKTEREAQKKLEDMIFDVRAHGNVLSGDTTVKKWSEEWLSVYVNPRDITKKSSAMYRQKLDKYILPAIGSMRIKDVRDIHLQKLLNSANTSKSTAQKVKIVTQAMFKQARKSHLIAYDPAEDLTLPKAPEGKGRSITDFERKHILEVAKTHYAGLYVLTVLYCGLRPGECIALRWADIDTENGTLRVSNAAESGNSKNIKDPKSAAGIRSVPIPASLLSRYKAEKPKNGDLLPVFVQPKGKKRHTESSLNDFWNNFKRDLDMHMGAKVYRNQIIKHCFEVNPMLETEEQWETLVPYCLRHTYGTDCQRAGVPLNVTKYLMGHSDVKVTANIYIDTTPDVVYDAAKALDGLHKKSGEKW